MSSLNYSSCIPDLISAGVHLLPGLRTYGLQLTPAAAPEAWAELFRAKELINKQIIAREERWTFDDEGNLRCIRGFDLKHKADKSHLTVTKEAADGLSRSNLLPYELRKLFDNAAQLISAVTEAILDVAPPAPFKTMSHLRIFEYRHSSPGCCGIGGHIDGSRFTTIVAQSDGCLDVLDRDNQWVTLDRNGQSFAVLLPGRAFAYSGIVPTVHRVRPIDGLRHSTTVFQSADLGNSKECAEQAAANWKW
jgi:hypothetical protein